MKNNQHLQRGMALFQILLLVSVLMVMLLAINAQSSQHIKLAQAVSDKTEADLVLHSQQNQLIMALLTEKWMQSEQLLTAEKNPFRWNFYDEPFAFNSVEHRIQDVGSLVNLYSPNERMVSALFNNAGMKQANALGFLASLRDWQDADDEQQPLGAEQVSYPSGIIVRNAPVQFEQELLMLPAMSEDFYRSIADWLTTYPVTQQNLYNMPQPLLSGFFGADLAGDLIKQRAAGTLSEAVFSGLSGIEVDDFYTYSAGPVFRLRTVVEVNGIRRGQQLTLVLDPYGTEPVRIWEQRRYNEAE